MVASIVEITGASPAIAQQVLDLYAQPGRKVLPDRGEIDVKGLERMIAFMAEAGQLKGPLPAPDRFVDLNYLRRAGIQ